MDEPDSSAAALHDLELIGLLGRMYRSDPNDVRAVGLAVDTGRAQDAHCRVYRAMADCMGGDVTSSRFTLEQHIEAHPEDDMARIVLGASLVMAGDQGGRAWMDAVLVTSSNPVLREAALTVIGLVEAGRRR
jgi:hypothetical protein